MTELTPAQKDLLNLFYQRVKGSIKKNKVDFDPSHLNQLRKLYWKLI
jgi:hypothetical protein